MYSSSKRFAVNVLMIKTCLVTISIALLLPIEYGKQIVE